MDVDSFQRFSETTNFPGCYFEKAADTSSEEEDEEVSVEHCGSVNLHINAALRLSGWRCGCLALASLQYSIEIYF